MESIRTAVRELIDEGMDISHAHLKYLNPFPKNLGELLGNFDRVLVPEMNNGQLVRLIRDKYFIPAAGINKITGRPFFVDELKTKIKDALASNS